MTSSENRATIPTGQHNIMCPCIMCHRLSPKSRYRVARFATINARLIARFQHLRAKEIGIHSGFRLRDGPILLQRGVIPAPDSAAWLSPPVGGRGQLARDSEMDGSYLLNTNSQNIVQCVAAQRAVTHRRCTENDTNRRTAICSFHRTVYGTNCQLAVST